VRILKDLAIEIVELRILKELQSHPNSVLLPAAISYSFIYCPISISWRRRAVKGILGFFERGALADAGALDDGNVPVDGEVGESFDAAARHWPMYLHPVYFGSWADAQDLTRIMGGEIAAATDF